MLIPGLDTRDFHDETVDVLNFEPKQLVSSTESWFLLEWLRSSAFRPGILPSIHPQASVPWLVYRCRIIPFTTCFPFLACLKGRPPSVRVEIRKQSLLTIGRGSRPVTPVYVWAIQIAFRFFAPVVEGKGPPCCKSNVRFRWRCCNEVSCWVLYCSIQTHS
jgi:hypothetical protein